MYRHEYYSILYYRNMSVIHIHNDLYDMSYTHMVEFEGERIFVYE